MVQSKIHVGLPMVTYIFSLPDLVVNGGKTVALVSESKKA